jgi:hypothetical protein
MMFKSRAGNKAPSKEANGSRQVGRKLEKNRKANVQFVSGTADFLFSFFSF